MLMHNTKQSGQVRLHTARRVFSLLPILVFLLTLMLLASASHSSYEGIVHIVLQSIATSLAASFVSIAAYSFYRYLIERSPGL